MNDTGRRLRDVERQPITLPEGADPLQTFESGSPLGDTLSLDFGANLRATLIGNKFVRVDATAGGEGGWDAIVDGTIGASNPEQRLFLGIGEALTYLYTTLGQTDRALVLVRSNPSSNLISDMPAGNTYVETAHITCPRRTTLVSTEWFGQGSGFPSAAAPGNAPRWDHAGFDVTPHIGGCITCFGFTIVGKEDPGGENKNAFFQGDAILVDCFLVPGQMTIDSGRYNASSVDAWLWRCICTNGWVAATEYHDCNLIAVTGSYNPFLATGMSASHNVMEHCRLQTPGGTPTTWTLSALATVVIDIFDKPSSGAGSPTFATMQLGGTNCEYYIRNRGSKFWNITNPTNAVRARIEGNEFGTITLIAPSTDEKHRVDVQDPSTVDITGPAVIDISTISEVKLRGSGVVGTVSTSRGSAGNIAISFINADQCAILAGGTPRIAGATPYNFDAASANNVLVFAGLSTWAAGVNLGTNNRILPEGAAPPAAGFAPADATYLVTTADATLTNEVPVGATPGGELGGTWGAPTVAGTHSGSAHADFIAKALVDAKGDVITATADDTPVRKAVGADGTALVADAAQADGLKWATPAVLNFAAATTLGTVVGKVEIFDATGASLGFLPVYDAIT